MGFGICRIPFVSVMGMEFLPVPLKIISVSQMTILCDILVFYI